MYKHWTKQQEDYVMLNYHLVGLKQIALDLNKTISAVNAKRLRLRILKKISFLKIGSKFGSLTVLELDVLKGRSKYKCLCDCGNIKSFYTSYLRNGDTKSCGCRSTDPTIDFSKKANGFTTLNRKFRIYKANAKKRNLNWHLSFDTFKDITCKNCFYCGIEPKLINCYFKINGDLDTNCSPNLMGRYNRNWINFNGIDRVNSEKGYELNNIVPCCSECNFMKKDLKLTDFINKIKLISSRF